MWFSFFFFNDTATTEIYTLSLHDALPISGRHARRGDEREGRHGLVPRRPGHRGGRHAHARPHERRPRAATGYRRSEEHTSELQSRQYLVCRLLLEKKKNKAR